MRRDAGFVQGHLIFALTSLFVALGLAIWLRGGVPTIGAGALYGIVLFVIAQFTPTHRVHVELGCLVALLATAIQVGVAVACRRAGFAPLVSLSIACSALAAIFTTLAVVLRRFDP